MSLFLFRFWPALLPLIVYCLWWLNRRSKARMAGESLPLFRDGPWYQAVLASLLVAMGCFIVIGLTETSEKGHYVPPHLENGEVVPGHVEK